MKIWGQSFGGRGHSKCKVLDGGLTWVFQEQQKGQRGRVVGRKVRERGKGMCSAFEALIRGLDFILSKLETMGGY